MARRIPAWEVLRLRSSNLSLNTIAAALHASKASVSVRFTPSIMIAFQGLMHRAFPAHQPITASAEWAVPTMSKTSC